MAKAPQFRVIFTPPAASTNVYIDKPDTQAPDGASWKPDGKYKFSLIFEAGDAAFEAFKAEFEAEGKKHFPEAEAFEFPWKDGKEGTKLEGYEVFTPKSARQPECFNAATRSIPASSISPYGDKLRGKVAMVPWSKEDDVKEKINGKIVTTKTKVYGVTARIYGVQLIEKSKGGSGGGGFDAVEGGYEGEGDEDPNVGQVSKPATKRAPFDDLTDDMPF